jgi:hypothetical protein
MRRSPHPCRRCRVLHESPYKCCGCHCRWSPCVCMHHWLSQWSIKIQVSANVKGVSTYRRMKRVRLRPVKRTHHPLCNKWKHATPDVSSLVPFWSTLCAHRGEYGPHTPSTSVVRWPWRPRCGGCLSTLTLTYIVVQSNQQWKSLILGVNKQNEQHTAPMCVWSPHRGWCVWSWLPTTTTYVDINSRVKELRSWLGHTYIFKKNQYKYDHAI